MSSEAAMNPTGGAESRRVMERCPSALVSVQLVVSTVEHESFPAKARGFLRTAHCGPA